MRKNKQTHRTKQKQSRWNKGIKDIILCNVWKSKRDKKALKLKALCFLFEVQWSPKPNRKNIQIPTCKIHR